ncbi:MAG: putative baseplate assembly protein [Chloroflexus sp.]|uniref:putative baseplate assembly protein n=1 Tax=Chloroflexus sp. TaxID=1904827 RepID=UPI00404B7C8D
MSSDQLASNAPCGCDERLVLPSPHTNPPAQPALHYRLGTHQSFLRRMIARLAQQPVADGRRPLAMLTTRDPADPSLALLDAAATLADVLTFYQERIANEGFLRTATERQSVLYLARAIGYELKPGVAASTYLAFTLDDSPAAPAQTLIPAGTQVQSIPVKQGELPQTFETTGDFVARKAWNLLRPRPTQPQQLDKGSRAIYLAGIDTRLQPGDYLLLVGSERERDPGNERWDLRRVLSVTPYPDPNGGYTVVTWEPGLGSDQPPMLPAAQPQVFALRRAAHLFGFNAPDWRLMPADVKAQYAGSASSLPTEWPGFAIDSSNPQLELDAAYPKIVPGSWIALLTPGYTELYRVTRNESVGVANFALSGQVTRLTVDTTENLKRFTPRSTLVLAESELLAVAAEPIVTPVTGQYLDVAGVVSDLQPGQPLIVSGKRSLTDGHPTVAVVFVAAVHPAADFTTIVLQDKGLDTISLIRSTTVIFANVVAATHGETTAAPIGSGDGSRSHQQFRLKKSPLSYVSATTPTGTASTLTVRVNGVLWAEVPSLYLADPDEQSYVVRIDDNGTATVLFGDGVQGARLPTGQENIIATYRFGIGLAGEVDAGALTLLKTRPPGVRSVTNPLAATGAEDPETLAGVRQNAPQTALTLDRIVSLQDVTGFANAFAGIGKAQAAAFRHGEQMIIHLTVATAGGDSPAATDPLLTNLRLAIDAVRDPAMLMELADFSSLTFRLTTTVRYDRRYRADNVRLAIETALTTTFSFTAHEFAQPVTAAEVIACIQSIAGVVAVDLDELAYASGRTGSHPSLLIARPARQIGATIAPAELLVLDPNGINLTLIGAALP